jgi:hypothetical protein
MSDLIALMIVLAFLVLSLALVKFAEHLSDSGR